MIELVEARQRELFEKWGLRFYPLQRRVVPDGRQGASSRKSDMTGILQLENGVGMLRLLEEEVKQKI